MLHYISRRLLLIIPTLLCILVVNFLIVQAAPGGPVDQAIARLQGLAVTRPRVWKLRADSDWPRPDARLEFLRARINEAGGAELYANQGSGVTTSLCWSDGLILNPPGKAIQKGDLVDFVTFAELQA